MLLTPKATHTYWLEQLVAACATAHTPDEETWHTIYIINNTISCPRAFEPSPRPLHASWEPSAHAPTYPDFEDLGNGTRQQKQPQEHHYRHQPAQQYHTRQLIDENNANEDGCHTCNTDTVA